MPNDFDPSFGELGGLGLHTMPGHLIRRLHQISLAIYSDRIARMGLDLTVVQFSALSVLAERPGIDQATLAGLIAYDRATIGGVIDRLEAKGLISRRISPRDRRARVLEATRKGLDLLYLVAPEVTASQNDLLAGLDDAERDVFLNFLKRLADSGNALSRAPLIRPDDP
ncbi:Nicotinate degradation protein R [Marinibacterium anthonyi]|nr:Nicotinate degradation protein R [Marinibacterium anthonyi]